MNVSMLDVSKLPNLDQFNCWFVRLTNQVVPVWAPFRLGLSAGIGSQNEAEPPRLEHHHRMRSVMKLKLVIVPSTLHFRHLRLVTQSTVPDSMDTSALVRYG